MSNNNLTAEAILGLKNKIEDGAVELLLDLEGDAYADPQNDNPYFNSSYAQVVGVEQETSECIVVHFEGVSSVGVPVYHKFVVGSLSE